MFGHFEINQIKGCLKQNRPHQDQVVTNNTKMGSLPHDGIRNEDGIFFNFIKNAVK